MGRVETSGIAARWQTNRRQRPEMRSQRYRQTTPRFSRLIIWFVSTAIFLPYTFGSTGKYVIALVFVPAVLAFFARVFQGQRSMRASDLFVWAMALWMIAAATITGTPEFRFQATSDAVAFLGSYMAARSFYFGESSLEEFIRVIRVITIVLFGLALLDTFSGRFFINGLMGDIFPHPPSFPGGHGLADLHRKLFGVDIIRATSTFPHPILYGTYCAVAGAILLYSEQSLIRRLFYGGICLSGCILSLSSGALLAYFIAISVWCYDRVSKEYLGRWRWKILGMILVSAICLVFLASNRPFGFFFDHFTLNPETGYWRMLIWEDAFTYIANAPFIGSPSAWAASDVLNDSVDCVWLLLALYYGIPAALFLLLANIAACSSFGRRVEVSIDLNKKRMRTAFSLAIMTFAFIGLTVHMWDAVWIFWGLCIGIRVSLEEYCLNVTQGSRRPAAVRFAGAPSDIRSQNDVQNPIFRPESG